MLFYEIYPLITLLLSIKFCGNNKINSYNN